MNVHFLIMHQIAPDNKTIQHCISYFIKCTPMRFPCFNAYFLEVTSQITSRGYFEQIVSFLIQFSLTKLSSDNRYNFATLRRHRGVFFFAFWKVLYTTQLSIWLNYIKNCLVRYLDKTSNCTLC
jgi:hypothetical protein